MTRTTETQNYQAFNLHTVSSCILKYNRTEIQKYLIPTSYFSDTLIQIERRESRPGSDDTQQKPISRRFNQNFSLWSVFLKLFLSLIFLVIICQQDHSSWLLNCVLGGDNDFVLWPPKSDELQGSSVQMNAVANFPQGSFWQTEGWMDWWKIWKHNGSSRCCHWHGDTIDRTVIHHGAESAGCVWLGLHCSFSSRVGTAQQLLYLSGAPFRWCQWGLLGPEGENIWHVLKSPCLRFVFEALWYTTST